MTRQSVTKFFKTYTPEIFKGSLLGLLFLSLVSVSVPALQSQGLVADARIQETDSLIIFSNTNVNDGFIRTNCVDELGATCRSGQYYIRLGSNGLDRRTNMSYSRNDNEYRARLPRNLDCNSNYDLQFYSRQDDRLLHSQNFNTRQYCDEEFRIAGQVDSVAYDESNLIITGRAVSDSRRENSSRNRSVSISFYTSPINQEGSRRIGSVTARADNDGYFSRRFSYNERLFETGRVYVYGEVEGFTYELNNSPVAVSRAEWDRQISIREQERLARRTTRTTPAPRAPTRTTPTRVVNRTPNNRTMDPYDDYNSPMQVLRNRYTSGVVRMQYTDSNQNYITLRDDTDLARVLQDHARNNGVGFGSQSHMDILRNQGVLVKRGSDWFVSLNTLESRID